MKNLKIDKTNWEPAFKLQLQYLNKIPRINHGGCGISAFALYNWFKQHNLIDDLNVKLYYAYCYEFYDVNNNFVKNIKENIKNRNTATSCSHAFLYVNGEYYDSTGNISNDVKHDYTYMHQVTDEFVFYTIQYTKWNPDFDRTKFLNRIYKRFNINEKDWESRLLA